MSQLTNGDRAPEVVAFVKLAHPGIVRVLCGIPELSGVILDCEHGAFTEPELETLAELARLEGKSAIVRTPSSAPDAVSRALDRGAAAVMIPRVRGAREVEEALRGAAYSPHGTRGYDPTVAAAGYGAGIEIPAPRVLVQIETREALSEVAEIAAVPGVTDLFLGPADLARALGEPAGAIFTDAVLEAMSALPEQVADSPVGLGLFVDGVERARRARALGYSLLAIGTDALFLRRAARALAQQVIEAAPQPGKVAW